MTTAFIDVLHRLVSFWRYWYKAVNKAHRSPLYVGKPMKAPSRSFTVEIKRHGKRIAAGAKAPIWPDPSVFRASENAGVEQTPAKGGDGASPSSGPPPGTDGKPDHVGRFLPALTAERSANIDVVVPAEERLAKK
jgi:hypothetical protein